jgi:integrase
MSGRLEGHVRKRTWKDGAGEVHEGSWEYVIELGKAGGKRRRPAKGGYRTQKLAKQALRDELRKREAGVFVAASDVTMRQYLEDRWLPWILERPKRPVRETTHAVYSDAARLYIVPTLGDTPVQEVTPADIDALYVSLAKGDVESGRGPIGQHSLHNVHTVMHGSLAQAVRWELLERNPAAAATAPERTPHEARHWSTDQLAAFLDLVDRVCAGDELTETRTRKNGVEYTYHRRRPPDPMQRAFWYLLAHTGMRRAEACGLRWPALDLKAGYLTIERGRTMKGGRVLVTDPKTRHGYRTLKLDPQTLATLETWRKEQARQCDDAGAAWEDAEHHVFTHAVVFSRPARHGVAVRPDWASHAFARLAGEGELPALGLHGLRHTWGTAAYEAGEPLRAISEHLGHADTSITDRVYVHHVRGVQDATALRVSELFASKRAGGRE